MTYEEEWESMMNSPEWTILSLEHPDYPLQQSFREVAWLTGETDPDSLYVMAMVDFLEYSAKDASDRIREAFKVWSVLLAKLNQQWQETSEEETR
jgi:hypothetical protein